MPGAAVSVPTVSASAVSSTTPSSTGVGSGGGLCITPAETGQQKAKTNRAVQTVLRMIVSSLTVEFAERMNRPTCVGWAACSMFASFSANMKKGLPYMTLADGRVRGLESLSPTAGMGALLHWRTTAVPADAGQNEAARAVPGDLVVWDGRTTNLLQYRQRGGNLRFVKSPLLFRSEERRVGKESRYRWAPDHLRK